MFSLDRSGNCVFLCGTGAIFPLREAGAAGALTGAGAAAAALDPFPLVVIALGVFTLELDTLSATGAEAITADGGADLAVSSALKNSCPLEKRSSGFFDKAFAKTLEIPSGTLGCALEAGNGSTSVMLRSISPVCLPAKGLRVV